MIIHNYTKIYKSEVRRWWILLVSTIMNRICLYIQCFYSLYTSFCVQQFKTLAFHLDSFLGLNKLTSNLCWYVGAKHWQYHTPIHVYEPWPTLTSKPSKYKGSAYLPVRTCRWWDGDSIPQASPSLLIPTKRISFKIYDIYFYGKYSFQMLNLSSLRNITQLNFIPTPSVFTGICFSWCKHMVIDDH